MIPENSPESKQPASGQSWFKAVRSPDALELILANIYAFVLAYIIAYRARWDNSFNADGLTPGEAMLGDHEKCGMTEQNYRTAKAQLTKWGFATFKATNKGTIGKLIDTRLFNPLNVPSNDQNNGQPTDDQRTGNGRVTGNIELKKKRSFRSKEVGAPSPQKTAEEIISELSSNPAYQGIDVRREYGKMQTWCSANHKQPTERRFVNWLNRCERPLPVPMDTIQNAGLGNPEKFKF